MEAKNHGQSLIHTTEKALSEHGDKIGEAEKTAIDTAVTDLKSALEGDDAEAINARTQTLMQASMKLGEAMYQAQQNAQGDGAETSEPEEEGVVDAEFEEVSDDKKTA